jgi:hypothetical protein
VVISYGGSEGRQRQKHVRRRCGVVCETMTTSRQGSRHTAIPWAGNATGFPEGTEAGGHTGMHARTHARTAHGDDRDASSRWLYSVVQGARALTSKDGG